MQSSRRDQAEEGEEERGRGGGWGVLALRGGFPYSPRLRLVGLGGVYPETGVY